MAAGVRRFASENAADAGPLAGGSAAKTQLSGPRSNPSALQPVSLRG
jgi:hypothetical protein